MAGGAAGARWPVYTPPTPVSPHPAAPDRQQRPPDQHVLSCGLSGIQLTAGHLGEGRRGRRRPGRCRARGNRPQLQAQFLRRQWRLERRSLGAHVRSLAQSCPPPPPEDKRIWAMITNDKDKRRAACLPAPIDPSTLVCGPFHQASTAPMYLLQNEE